MVRKLTKPLVCDHANESYWTVLSCDTATISGGSSSSWAKTEWDGGRGQFRFARPVGSSSFCEFFFCAQNKEDRIPGPSPRSATDYGVQRVLTLTSANVKPATLVTRVGKKSFYMHFAPPHPYAILTKHFHLTQVCILPFSKIERGNGGVDTYSVDITIIISCFSHFPTQFVQDCRMNWSPITRLDLYIVCGLELK